MELLKTAFPSDGIGHGIPVVGGTHACAGLHGNKPGGGFECFQADAFMNTPETADSAMVKRAK